MLKINSYWGNVITWGVVSKVLFNIFGPVLSLTLLIFLFAIKVEQVVMSEDKFTAYEYKREHKSSFAYSLYTKETVTVS